MSFFIAGLFSSIGHIGKPAKYMDLSINSQNSGFLDCHEISEELRLYDGGGPATWITLLHAPSHGHTMRLYQPGR